MSQTLVLVRGSFTQAAVPGAVRGRAARPGTVKQPLLALVNAGSAAASALLSGRSVLQFSVRRIPRT